MPKLYLRKVNHPQAHNNFRVILKSHGCDIEIGSVGVQYGNAGAEHWTWGIDTVVPMRDIGPQGRGKGRHDCTKQFRAAWDRLSADPARLSEFLRTKHFHRS